MLILRLRSAGLSMSLARPEQKHRRNNKNLQLKTCQGLFLVHNPPNAVDYISDVDADGNPCKPKPIGIIVKMENGARYYHWYE